MARPTVAGYCWPQSVAPGQRVGLHVSSSLPAVDVEVARVGAARQVVHEHPQLPADDPRRPRRRSSNGCGWPVSLELDTTGWSTGYHEVRLTGTSTVGRRWAGPSSSCALRPTAPGASSGCSARAPGTPTTTSPAGTSTTAARRFALPADGARLPAQATGARPAGRHHPPARPAAGRARRLPPPQPPVRVGRSAGWPNWEHPFALWAERNGYEIDVASSADLEVPSLLSRYRLLLSIGHDEYWSGPMRDSVEAFIAGGGNVAFLSGNTAFWQIRYEDDGRTIVGYKGRFADDPCYRTDRHAETTTIWSDHELGRPENAMTGVSFSRGGYHRIGTPGDQRRRRLHGPPARPLAVRGHRAHLRRPAGRRSDRRRLRVRRLRPHLPRRPAVPDRERRHAGRRSRSSAPRPPPRSPGRRPRARPSRT